jgi:uncharacterized protein
MFLRHQNFAGLGRESAFLWGARQTGKTTLLKQQFPDALYIDLLLSDVYMRFRTNPGLLREIVAGTAANSLIIIDEIQRIPELLNEIHWLLTKGQGRFIMSGSSPRKIIREGYNLLGGRALRYELYPLVFPEIDQFDLLRALNNGMIPRHYLSQNPKKLLSAYLGSYLVDEIAAEAKIRNIATFSQFLEKAAFSNGEMVNYSNIAADCGVSSPTIKEYFHILQDTLIGRFLPAYQKNAKRRVITSPKFYLFDIGIANYLLKRESIEPGSETFGKAFEHFIYQELYAHSRYTDLNYDMHFWRTTSGIEIDFVLGRAAVAIEVKSTSNAQRRHTRGLEQFGAEFSAKKLLLVTNDPWPRKIGEVQVMPWKAFLEDLWQGKIISRADLT